MLNSILGALELGLVYGLMVLGVYITFRILKIPDLTVDGSVTLGMAVSAIFVNMGHPVLALLAALLAGALAGSVTALLQNVVKIPPILSGILTMSGLYSINLLIMEGGKPNISILGAETIYSIAQKLGLSKHAAFIVMSAIVVTVIVVLVELFFTTHTGLCICATGDNEEMVRASSISPSRMKWIALAIANACVAVAGALYTQYIGGADITAGSGTIVVGFASVIIGETVCVKRNIKIGFVSAIVGSILYRVLIAVAVKTNLFPTYFLRFVSVLIMVVALGVGPLKKYIESQRNKGKREKEDA